MSGFSGHGGESSRYMFGISVFEWQSSLSGLHSPPPQKNKRPILILSSYLDSINLSYISFNKNSTSRFQNRSNHT
jgi:hypothetical protein